jgi:hypothetical protein
MVWVLMGVASSFISPFLYWLILIINYLFLPKRILIVWFAWFYPSLLFIAFYTIFLFVKDPNVLPTQMKICYWFLNFCFVINNFLNYTNFYYYHYRSKFLFNKFVVVVVVSIVADFVTIGFPILLVFFLLYFDLFGSIQ